MTNDEQISLNAAFDALRQGNKMSDADLVNMIQATEQALPWLEANRARVGSLAIVEAHVTLETLKRYQSNRANRFL